MFEFELYETLGLCIALVPIIYLVVYVAAVVINLVAFLAWKFIDEGDSECFDLGPALSKPFETKVERWAIEVEAVDHCEHYIYDRVNNTEESAFFKYEADNKCKQLIRELPNGENYKVDVAVFSPKKLIMFGALVPFGIALAFLPMTTLTLGSVVLTMYALRWSRRGIKQVKKVKQVLDTHVADKEKHNA
jgi:hypothetical protein